MRHRKHPVRFAAVAALVSLAFSACDAPVTPTEDSSEAKRAVGPGTSQQDLLKALRQETARFHSVTQALKAGYESTPDCVAVPGLGGMGFHWVNAALVDPLFDPLRPEALLYAPKPNGGLRLVAVEYIVINAGQARPSFGGQLFDVGGAPIPVPHWTLHVWFWEDNPSAMFAPFNPAVSCAAAE